MSDGIALPAAGDAAVRFDAFLESFSAAAGRTGEVRRDYTIAGYPVHLRFAGDALIPEVTTALAHLESQEPAVPELDVACWDAVSTGLDLLPAVGSRGDYENAQAENHQLRMPRRGFAQPQ